MSTKEDIYGFDVFWNGPFSWPKFEEKSGLPSIPKSSGVYLQTFRYLNGYLIYSAGITRRPFPVRFREHSRSYMNGDYNVLDPSKAEQGVREEIWHGWSYAKTHRSQFEERKLEIQEAVKEHLARFCLFVAEIGTERRLLERIEGSIMKHLSEQPPPYCSIPDQGMMLAPRWDHEIPRLMRNYSKVKIYGIPKILVI
jgi:hypothetical protein